MVIDSDKLMKDMGKRYFEARKAKGITQEQAAEIAEVTQQTISNTELGKSFLSPVSMLRLCYAYGVSGDYLLTGQISDMDVLVLDKRVRQLDAETFAHFKRMTEHFLAAMKQK